jgi:hypothetical protein
MQEQPPIWQQCKMKKLYEIVGKLENQLSGHELSESWWPDGSNYI